MLVLTKILRNTILSESSEKINLLVAFKILRILAVMLFSTVIIFILDHLLITVAQQVDGFASAATLTSSMYSWSNCTKINIKPRLNC